MGAPAAAAQAPSFHVFRSFLCSQSIPIPPFHPPTHTHNLLHTGLLNTATFMTLKLFSVIYLSIPASTIPPKSV